MVGGNGGQGEIKISSASTPSTNDQANDLIFSPHSTAKTNYKSTNLRKNDSGISDVAGASVHSEKTHLKKLMMMMKMMIMMMTMIIIITNKSQETTVFGGLQKLTSAIKLRPEK